MKWLLEALLRDLLRRCEGISQRLVQISSPELNDLAVGAYATIETLRRRIAQLLADPAIGHPRLLRNQLESVRRISEQVSLVEWYPLTFVERFGPDDLRLTRLASRIAAEVGWPLPPPLVTSASTEYYFTQPLFGLIYVPATEPSTLLGLPDLGHEFGHNLLVRFGPTLTGDFSDQVEKHFRRVAWDARAAQRPIDQAALERLRELWRGPWLSEFASDMIATFLLGPAYVWQHLRLSANHGEFLFLPIGETEGETHPADDARFRGVTIVLERLGAGDDARVVSETWNRYAQAKGERQATGFDEAYPADLLNQLADRIVDGCGSLGINGFDKAQAGSISTLLNEAWRRFRDDSSGYGAWEEAAVLAMWNELS